MILQLVLFFDIFLKHNEQLTIQQTYIIVLDDTYDHAHDNKSNREQYDLLSDPGLAVSPDRS